MPGLNKGTHMEKDEKKNTLCGAIYDRSAIKIVLFACLVIVLSVSIIGAASYIITNNAVVDKLKSKDLVYIAQSISSKIEGRIDRAKEISISLARDPAVMKWVQDGEKDEELGGFAKQKITDIAASYDYSNSFIVSAVTNHYWAEGGKLIDTMSKNDPDDSWFFDVTSSKKPVSVVIDYNNERHDTFVFIDALMGDVNHPLAVAGVGLNLKDISREFQSYKFGEKSNMWLIDNKGSIYITEDLDHINKNISDFLPVDISQKLISQSPGNSVQPNVLNYVNNQGETYDLIFQPIKSTDWKLVFQIPRDESISVLGSIKMNTIIVSLITIILIVFMFYFISNRIANPYKRAVLLNMELEEKVRIRTEELNEKNIKIIDSIEYAKMIQESILPSEDELKLCFSDYLIIWKPRDIVGGDFYWAKKMDKGFIVAVGDCTGHGVPGALMTMTANSILNHITDKICNDDPALILNNLNKILKQTLHRKDANKIMDDGLNIGIVIILKNRDILYSGAGLPLYIRDRDKFEKVKADRKGIGYRTTPDDYVFTKHYIKYDEHSVYYMTTDGFTDQNGGDKDYSYGGKRFEDVINECYQRPLTTQKEMLEESLTGYMDGEAQRDDITVLGFKP